MQSAGGNGRGEAWRGRAELGKIGLYAGIGERQKLRGGHIPKQCGVASDAQPLGALEEEELVLHDRPADGVSELVAGIFALRNALHGVVVGVSGVIGEAVKLPRRSMEAVAAALAGQVNHAAGGAPVLGLEVVGHDAEFLNSVLRNPERNGRVEDVRVLDAVEQDFSSGSALAIDGVAHAAIGVVLTGTDELGIAA